MPAERDKNDEKDTDKQKVGPWHWTGNITRSTKLEDPFKI
jgi:hypothetical protein